MGSFLFVGRSREVEEDQPRVLKRIHKRTGISMGDLREMNFIFRQEHPTGRVTIDEFIGENVAAHGGCEAFWERVYRFIDSESGKQTQPLTFEQIIMTIMARRTTSAVSQQPTEKSLKQLFRFIDIGGDGAVDEDELTVVFTWCYELQESRQMRVNPEVLIRFCSHIPQVMRAVASNTPIQLQKLKTLCPALLDPRTRAKQVMSQLDGNSDGTVSEFEFIDKCRADQIFIEVFSFIPRN
jgi:Ca2+-binding EF-hand superfamily protein